MTDSRQSQSELLSAYLDDSVSPDERAHIEQMLAHDASLRRELEGLKTLEQDLQESFKGDVHLDPGFQDRVWSAVIAQAELENLPDNHPVRLAERQPARTADSNRKPWVAAIAALAASVILVAAWNLQPDDNPIDNAPTVDGIVGVVPSPIDSIDDPATSDPEPFSPDEAIAAVDPASHGDSVMVNATDNTPESVAPQPIEVATTDTPKTTIDAAEPDGNQPAPKIDVSALAYAMLLEVQLTQRGKDLGELDFALETVGISDVEPYRVKKDQIEQFVSSNAIGTVDVDTPAEIDGDTQLLLVQGPAKRIDRLVVSLFGRPGVVEKVGFRMAMDHGLSLTLKEIGKVNARMIQHSDTDAMAHHLVFGATKFFPGSTQPFATMTKDGAQAMRWTPAPPKDEGPDFQTQILLLVRCPK